MTGILDPPMTRIERANLGTEASHASQRTGGNSVHQVCTRAAAINGTPVIIIHKSDGPLRPVKSPARLIVCISGNSGELEQMPSRMIFCRIARALSNTKNTNLLGVHRNKKGNIILSFDHDTPGSTLTSLIPTIRARLEIAESVMIIRDVPWSKIMVSYVRTRERPGTAIFTEADLARSFLLNPAIKDLTITGQPRWIRKPESITGAHSSFVFAFEDRDGTIAQNILNTRLFVFGAPVTTRPWVQNAKSILNSCNDISQLNPQ